MDNLLLSFDRMPGQDVMPSHAPHLNDSFDYAASPPRVSHRMPQRPRGHTYSSSLSTDMASVEDSASSYSRNLSSRGHRSNSSSSFLDSPVSMPRIRDGRPRVLARSSSETQRPARNMHMKASKNSAGSSFDYGYGQMIVAGSHMSRSPNRENGFTQSAPEMLSESILSRGRPVPSQFSTYETPCPEPNVPGGPRNEPNALTPSQSQASMVGPTKSQTSIANPAMSHDIPQSIRDQASDFVRASTMRTASASPKPDHVSFFPSAVPQSQMSANDAAQQRPGFFRRVFGSANRSSSAAEISKQLSRESSMTYETPPLRKKSLPNPNPANIPPQARPESRNARTNSAPANGVVSKKPSFFRRRKKSVTQDSAPPSLPQHFLTSLDQRPAPPSPGASSLRKVLDQYLVDPDAPTPSGQVPLSRFATESEDGDSDGLDMFHSGYTPPPDASIRREAPLDHRGSVTNRSDSSGNMVAPKPRTPSDPEKLQVMTAQREETRPVFRNTNSFLSDASDDDRNRCPSIISAVSETYGLPTDDDYTPVSPLISPTSENPPGGTFFMSPSSTNSDHPVSPGATIRAVASQFGGSSPIEWNYDVTESKGLSVNPMFRQNDNEIWIDSTRPEDLVSTELSLPLEGFKAAPTQSPKQLPPRRLNDEIDRKGSVPVVEVNGNEVRPSVDIARQLNAITSLEPTPEDMERARKIYSGDEEFLGRLQAAAWLGEKSQVSARTLGAFMSFFDWQGQNILSAMRSLCDKLVLRGESQQVDRILEAFADRWHACNPRNGFKGTGESSFAFAFDLHILTLLGVIHNICYALLLLNTDHHIANIQHKMTRSEFIKNTIPSIKDAIERTIKPIKQNSRPPVPWQESTSSVPNSPTAQQFSQDDSEDRSSIDFKRSMKRLSLRPGMNRNETDPGPGGDINNYASNILINHGYDGSEKHWLLEIETVLKSFYTSITADALPLHQGPDKDGPGTSGNNLTVSATVLRRTGSVISKAPSEGYQYRRKVSDTQSLTQKWHSKNRPRQKIYPASTVGSSRTSFDDNNSMLSPAGSSMWSRISNGRTQPTMSVESFALTHDFKQSLGFTNALSQAIIREEATSDTESFHRVGSLLEDESLELAGAPWAKEGMVKHKHHLEGPEKKAKERSWNEVFAVVEKGYLHLFSFNRNPTTRINNGTIRARRHTGASKPPSVAPSVVGGGNWTDNAEELGQFLLRQTIATTLPSPGYSKARPHVWALSLPTGAVHLFQVGTAEIAEEFASTANYWSARLSKEPLVGGVDNIEYGWSDNVLNTALLTTSTSLSPPPSRQEPHHGTSNSITTITNIPRPSMQSSLRTSLDQGFGSKPRLPGDRAMISDWRPPASSMLPSQLLEIDQLRSLRGYITSIESELAKHNDLRNAIPLAYSNSSGTRLGRVMGNWEKKSSYLLKEVVKFRTYIEALEKAGIRREKVYEERRIREEENAALGFGNAAKARQGSVAASVASSVEPAS